MRSECERVGNLISDYVDGALRPSEHTYVAAHVERCEQCGREVERARRLVGRLGGLAEDKPPYDLWPSVAQRISTPPSRRSVRDRVTALVRWRVIAIPVAAAAAALLIFLAHPGTPPPDSEYRAYTKAYTEFRGRQSLTDRDAVVAAAELQNMQSTPR